MNHSTNPNHYPYDQYYQAETEQIEPIARSDQSETESTSEILLGNPELPIANYREKIIDTVNNSQATVITAETGAGKSTQVPQFLAQEGYKVIVTQPRVIAARSLADRVSEEIVNKTSPAFEKFVGYRTAKERNDHPDNQILFVTDGLQMIRELTAAIKEDEKQVLILDEVHEWNINMEILLAWSKKQMLENSNFKVVCMSATMDANNLANFYQDNPAPIIDVPGRTFPVEKEQGGNVIDATKRYAEQGKNTLVFAPGKEEINRIVKDLSNLNLPNTIILPLHGQLDRTEQRKVFKHYPGMTKIIVSTNVAQTSITIDDIQAVVDTGLERCAVFRNGVDSLFLQDISQADCLQRAGRAGRIGPGEYTLAALEGENPKPLEERSGYPIPEIQRSRLDKVILHIAKAGFDINQLDFYHKPNPKEVASAKQRLWLLGALDKEDNLTKIGHQMERMPVESHYARMMVEAKRFSPEVQQQMAGIIAVLEAGDICMHSTRNIERQEKWRSLLNREYKDSEPIMRYDLFLKTESMPFKQLKEYDFHTKTLQTARDTLRQLRKAAKLNNNKLTAPNPKQLQQLIECIIPGMIESIHPVAKQPEPEFSRKGLISSVYRDEIYVCNQFSITTNRGSELTFARDVTRFSAETLLKVLPGLAQLNYQDTSGNYEYGEDGVITDEVGVTFNNQCMLTTVRTAIQEPANWSYSYKLESKVSSIVKESPIFKQLEYYWQRDHEILPNADAALSYAMLRKMNDQVPSRITNLNQITTAVDQWSIDDFISQEYRDNFEANFPLENNSFLIQYNRGKPHLDDSFVFDKKSGTIEVIDHKDDHGNIVRKTIPLIDVPYEDFFLPNGQPLFYDHAKLYQLHNQARQKYAYMIESFEARDIYDDLGEE